MKNTNINYKKRNILLIILLSIIMITMLIFIFWTDSKISSLLNTESTARTDYQYHFSMVTNSSDNPYWDMVYESASKKAIEMNSVLEIAGKTSSKDYSLFDKLNMAIAEKVDGIIIASDGSDTINSLIVDAASQNDIDIISLMENDLGYGRNGFIGINNYDQGNAYGYLLSNIIGDKNELEVALLKPSSKQNHTLENYSYNVIYSGLVEYLNTNNLADKINISIAPVNQINSFNCKRDIIQLLSQNPEIDVIICPDYLFTINSCQVVVDQNLVGNTKILGSYISNEILDYIDKGTLYATVAIDPYELGETSIEELIELKTYERTNDYMPLEMQVIRQDNVSQYINKFINN